MSIRPSIGIAMGPDDGRDADELLQHADVAMYVAKRTGSVRRLYSRNLDHYSPDRLSLAGELRDAIATASGEVHLAFQPKLDLLTDEIKGVECLVRWKHPQRGFVPPAEFLPIIENTELISPLTWLVLDQALGTCATWRRHGLEIKMAVNISARTIGSPELVRPGGGRAREVRAAGERPRARAHRERPAGRPQRGGRERHDGSATSVSASRSTTSAPATPRSATSTTMPISAVKIDRSFVDNMFSDPAAAAVVNFSLGLGQQLGLEVVAEGIEDEPTLEELRRLGCNTAQGYFISRPLGATEFLHWLLAWSTRHLTPADVAPELDASPSSDGGQGPATPAARTTSSASPRARRRRPVTVAAAASPHRRRRLCPLHAVHRRHPFLRAIARHRRRGLPEPRRTYPVLLERPALPAQRTPLHPPSLRHRRRRAGDARSRRSRLGRRAESAGGSLPSGRSPRRSRRPPSTISLRSTTGGRRHDRHRRPAPMPPTADPASCAADWTPRHGTSDDDARCPSHPQPRRRST